MRSSVKIYSFMATLSLMVVLVFSSIYFFPASLIAQAADIFENDSVNFIFLMSICIFLGLVCLEFTVGHYLKLAQRRKKFLRIGEILVSLELIDEIQLSEALNEQKRRTGEILMQAGRITMKQLRHALGIQKKSPEKMGSILIESRYCSKKDIQWALRQAKRKLGEILLEKELISSFQLQYVLSIQSQQVVWQNIAPKDNISDYFTNRRQTNKRT